MSRGGICHPMPPHGYGPECDLKDESVFQIYKVQLEHVSFVTLDKFFTIKLLRPRLHGIGSKTIRIDMGTDRPCVYTGPGVSVYFWICYPNTFGFAFKSGYFWIRTLSIPCKRVDRIQKCTDRK